MPLGKVLQEDRRLVILRFLSEDPDYTLNTSVLQSALSAYGHGVSRDRVETDCAWLNEQELVVLEKLGNVTVVTLTARGQDVAEGKATVPGVKRPRAGI